MSDNSKTKPTRTLAELSGRTSADNRVTISEEQDFRVMPRRNSARVDEASNITTIDELNQAFLTPDVRTKKEEELTKDKKGKLGKHDGQKRRKPDDNARIFEEGDIIDWMFKNIIMKSMDWAANQVVNLTSFGVGWLLDETTSFVASASGRAKKKMKNKWDKWNPFNGEFNKYPEDNTTKFRKTIADFHNKEMKNCDAYASEDNFSVLMSAMYLVHEGRIDELNAVMNGRISPQTMAMLNNLTPEQRQQAFSMGNAMEAAEDAIETAMTVKQYAANMAYIRLMNDKMNDKNQPKKDAATLFAEYEEEARVDMLAYMAEAQRAGKSPEQVKTARDELVILSTEAGKHIDKQVENRNYNEHDNKPSRNRYLDRIEDLTAVTKDSPYRNNTQFVDFMQEVIDISTTHQQAMRPLQNEEDNLSSRWSNNQDRRDKLHNVVNNIQQRRAANNTQQTQQAYQQQGGRV